eukprot:1290845-Rhodomonas_salina.2
MLPNSHVVFLGTQAGQRDNPYLYPINFNIHDWDGSGGISFLERKFIAADLDSNAQLDGKEWFLGDFPSDFGPFEGAGMAGGVGVRCVSGVMLCGAGMERMRCVPRACQHMRAQRLASASASAPPTARQRDTDVAPCTVAWHSPEQHLAWHSPERHRARSQGTRRRRPTKTRRPW